MRFLVDTQLPAALAHWLRERGHEAEHVLEVNLAQSKDTPILRYAQEPQAVIVTKDEDFAEWVRRGRPGPPVAWLRIGNSSKRDLLDWLEPILPVLVRKLEEGERLVEIRSGKGLPAGRKQEIDDVKMKLKSRRIRSVEELLAIEDKLPAVCGPSPSAFAARYGLKLSKPYVAFLRSQSAKGNGARKPASPRRKLVAA